MSPQLTAQIAATRYDDFRAMADARRAAGASRSPRFGRVRGWRARRGAPTAIGRVRTV
jgi:hypothetical protein